MPYFQCPICHYDRLPSEPREFLICPNCMVEFGYDDSNKTHEQLRDEWLKRSLPPFGK